MTRLTFTKMHGLGNDFVIFDVRQHAATFTTAQIRFIADRKLGIGCDQVIIIESGPTMRILNPDGSEVETCGNALRCVGLLLSPELGHEFSIQTAGGVATIHVSDAASITVDMGQGNVAPSKLNFDEYQLNSPDHVTIGNPHLVFFENDIAQIPLSTIGPKIEHHPNFPGRINVEFAEIASAHDIKMRVWERGAGITEACGSGACAVALSALHQGLAKTPMNIHMPGGTLQIHVDQDNHVRMTGPATFVFTGEIIL